jgi:hypothetical protein
MKPSRPSAGLRARRNGIYAVDCWRCLIDTARAGATVAIDWWIVYAGNSLPAKPAKA